MKGRKGGGDELTKGINSRQDFCSKHDFIPRCKTINDLGRLSTRHMLRHKLMLQRQHRNAPPSVPLSQNNTSSQWGGVKSELKNMRTLPEMGIVKRSTSLEPYDTVDGPIPNGRRRGVCQVEE